MGGGAQVGGRATGIVPILEAAYRVEQSPAEWLAGMLAAARPRLDRGGGVEAYFVDCSSGFEASGHVRLGVRSDELWADWVRSVPVEAKRRVHTFAPAGYSARMPSDARDAESWASERGVGLMGVNAIDASLRGATLVSHDGVRPRRPPTPAELARWAYLSAHVAAGARLVRRSAPAAEPEAVLSAEGRVLHADGPARDAAARSALRRAAIEIDRARVLRRSARDEDETLARWNALVMGRWTLLDSFEENGRRYVVARPNAPDASGRPLSERERQVAAAASLGHANKLIAYELGLAESTVATLLQRVRRKLGVTSRVALVRRLRGEQT